jgi:type II secretory pathway predicted ATPase ExeA
MYQEHFGITDAPLGKKTKALWDDGQLEHIKTRFDWLLKNPGVGVLTGDVGVGKTSVLRQLVQPLNPHRFQVIYLSETDFGRVDLYRSLALALGLEPAFRRAQVWRDVKARIQELHETQHILPIWIIDEAQNLPPDFFKDFPAFLNFAFDASDMMTVWLVGLPELASTLKRGAYAALKSRIQVHVKLSAVSESRRFSALIEHALKDVGCEQRLLSDTGMDLLRQGSQGRPRQAGFLLQHAMRLAVPKGLNHLPDDLIVEAIESQHG